MILSDDAIAGLTKRTEVVREFPELLVSLPRKGCGCRSGQNAAAWKTAYVEAVNRVKRSMMALRQNPARLARLKQLLRADTLKFFVASPGQVEQVDL